MIRKNIKPVIPFVFSLPSFVYVYIKLKTVIVDPRGLFSAGFLAGVFGVSLSLIFGVWLSSYYEYKHPVTSLRQVIIRPLLHACVWLLLFVVLVEIFLAIKFPLLFPVRVGLWQLIVMYAYFCVYAFLLLLVIRIVSRFLGID